MNGERRDLLAVIARGVLGGLAMPYEAAVRWRNRRYDRGVKEIHQCGVPVISVGNLTTGGTGKTPIVCYLAKYLRETSQRVAIVSRGYGRGDQDANDEALELHDRLPDVPHVQDPDRVEAARIATEELEATVILMDDGFQHRRLHRDLNIVVVDATCPFGFGRVLPRGLLREPIDSLQRADLVMLSRCDSINAEDLRLIIETVQRHSSVPIVQTVHQPKALLEFPATTKDIDEINGKRVAVVSAIGNPQAFENTIRGCGATIIGSRQLADHDAMSRETVEELQAWIRSLESVDRVVCTHKDLVKLKSDRLGGRPLQAVLIDLIVTDGEDVLRQTIDSIV